MANLTDSERKALESNSNVLRVTESNVAYTSKFKIAAVKALLKGKIPIDIFRDAGIPLAPFGKDYAKGCLKKWRKIYDELGEAGLKDERRGKNATGRPKKPKFRNLEEEVAYLREEVDFLKKLRALEELSAKNKSSR